MLIDLLQSSPSGNLNQYQQHSPFSPSSDRLITGNYKTNGNLVSLKIDILDCTEFQQNGCLSSPGTGGLSTSHSHNVTGTLFCQPDTNTVRLNITVVGGPGPNLTSNGGHYDHHQPPKDVKPWVLHTSNKMTSGSTNDSGPMLVKSSIMDEVRDMMGCNDTDISGNMSHNGGNQYNDNSTMHPPVSPPMHDAPPPLMDFHSAEDQLMSEIHSLSFDYGGGVTINSQLLSADTSDAQQNVNQQNPRTHNNQQQLTANRRSSTTAAVGNCTSLNNSQQQQQQQHIDVQQQRNKMLSGGGGGLLDVKANIKQEPPAFSLQVTNEVAQALASLSPIQSSAYSNYNTAQQQQQHHNLYTTASTLTPPHQPGSITTTTKIHFGGGNVHHMTGLPTLLQPKLERSDSICSEYSTTTVKDDLLSYADDLDGESSSLSNSSPTLASSPLLFPPSSGGGNSPTTLASSPLLFPSCVGGALSPSSTIIFSSNSNAQDKNSYFSKSFTSQQLDSMGISHNLNQAPKWQLTPATCSSSPSVQTLTTINNLINNPQQPDNNLTKITISPSTSNNLFNNPSTHHSTNPNNPTSSSNLLQQQLFQSLSSLTEPPQLAVGSGGNNPQLVGSGRNPHPQPAAIGKSRHQSSTVTSSSCLQLKENLSNLSPPSRLSDSHPFLLNPSSFMLTTSSSPLTLSATPLTISAANLPSFSTTSSTAAGNHQLLLSTAPQPPLPTAVSTTSSPPKPRNRRNSSFDESKPHICGQCGARFTTKSNLGQHAKIHLAVKPFICEICSHGFTRAAHYESHVAKHKGLKTHRCDQCGESFARLDNLLRHSARHKHGKIFDCSTCGKGFHRKDKLVEHEKVHSEYKFQCTRCTKAFHTNDALKHHLPNHEDPTKTQCHICLKFITAKSLSKHMASSHKEPTTTTTTASLAGPPPPTSSLEHNNNTNCRNNGGSKKNKGNEEKNIPCQYCKKSFVSPAKLRLHVAKCHAVEKSNAIEAARAAAAAQQQQQAEEQQQMAATVGRVFMDVDYTTASKDHQVLQFGATSGVQQQHQLSKDQLISAQLIKDQLMPMHNNKTNNKLQYSTSSNNGRVMQQQVVPELELSYINSSPEEAGINMDSLHKVSGGSLQHQVSGGGSLNIPTIHIPEFEPKLGPNEISTEALQALLFN